MADHEFLRAVDALRSGGTVAYPTDTVYGLGSHGLDPDAVRRVFTIKQRPVTMAVPLLVADLEMLRFVVACLPNIATDLVERFMPGPLTLVLRRSPVVPDIVTAGGDTVAVRIPDHAIPRRLARELGAPIVGTSANRSGMPSPVSAEEVRTQLGADVDLILDGVCSRGVESTIVDLSGKSPVILRQGALSAEEISRVTGVPIPARQH